MDRKKRKKVATVSAGVLALAVALTGTYAWQSISQQAKNETVRTSNPGGRLHDDFDGTNKDVYVENFSDPDDGGKVIFARVRLDEYMERGKGAGEAEGTDGKTATSLVDGAKIGDVKTWTTHIPNKSDDLFHDYWTWTMGGEVDQDKIYMPTFNKNKDSLKADINGTWTAFDSTTNKHYTDYTVYTEGQTKSGDATYDNDDNNVEEDPATPTSILTKTEDHVAAKTLKTEAVITMAQWKAMGSPIGKYWVYDVDGWAYWAEPIEPGTATGLLLDGIKYKDNIDDDVYYGINVVGQFVTAGDWGLPGAKEDGTKKGTGFFDTTDENKVPTNDAIGLLSIISKEQAVKVSLDGESATPVISNGKTLTFKATVNPLGIDSTTADQTVKWSVEYNKEGTAEAKTPKTGTKITDAGVLSVDAAEENNTELKVIATSEKYGVVGEMVVTVKE